jgi:uncharacterized membrane-anchored protein
MDNRSKLQLRLQQTVEGLSVVAITYYSMSLIKLMVDPLPVEAYVPFGDALIVAVSTPLVFICTLLMVRRIRKKLGDSE